MIKGKMICDSCGKPWLIPSLKGVPVTLQCPDEKCKYSFTWRSKSDAPRHLPKTDKVVDPPNTNWVVSYPEGETKKDNELSKEFQNRNDKVASLIGEAVALVNSLSSDYEKLGLSLVEDFGNEWGANNALKEGWNPDKVHGFIRNPFISVHNNSGSRNFNKYSRFILSPSFYDLECMGFKVVSSVTGLNVRLMTPYSRMAEPIPSWLEKIIEVDPLPKLEIAGQKVIGEELPFYWNEIPGVVEDIDHTDFMPSIKIGTDVNSKINSRKWFVSHGINPFVNPGLLSTDKPGIPFASPDEVNLFENAYDTITKKGRIILCWSNDSQIKRFIGIVDKCLDGYKVYLSDKEYYSKNRNRTMLSNSLMFMDIDEALERHDALNEFRMIVVDYRSAISVQDLERLHHYNGMLILLISDPIMDCLEENEEAATVYSLGGSISVRYSEESVSQKRDDYIPGNDQFISVLKSMM